ncbi:ATP synthase F1, epsilon subunit, partial [Listeria monocytogenes FSL F2-208]
LYDENKKLEAFLVISHGSFTNTRSIESFIFPSISGRKRK